MRVGLVLGAGGVMGGAWLTGALHALALDTSWDPASADHLVGTSAGSMIGGLLGAVSRRGSWSPTPRETFDGLTDAQEQPQGGADCAAVAYPASR